MQANNTLKETSANLRLSSMSNLPMGLRVHFQVDDNIRTPLNCPPNEVPILISFPSQLMNMDTEKVDRYNVAFFSSPNVTDQNMLKFVKVCSQLVENALRSRGIISSEVNLTLAQDSNKKEKDKEESNQEKIKERKKDEKKEEKNGKESSQEKIREVKKEGEKKEENIREEKTSEAHVPDPPSNSDNDYLHPFLTRITEPPFHWFNQNQQSPDNVSLRDFILNNRRSVGRNMERNAERSREMNAERNEEKNAENQTRHNYNSYNFNQLPESPLLRPTLRSIHSQEDDNQPNNQSVTSRNIHVHLHFHDKPRH